MEVIAVIVNKDNVVENSFAFTDNDKAESMFVDQVIEQEGDGHLASDELNGAISDGYWECSNGKAVCITHLFIPLGS